MRDVLQFFEIAWLSSESLLQWGSFQRMRPSAVINMKRCEYWRGIEWCVCLQYVVHCGHFQPRQFRISMGSWQFLSRSCVHGLIYCIFIEAAWIKLCKLSGGSQNAKANTIATMCESNLKPMQGEKFKCEKLSVEQRQGQINFYLIWPRLNLKFCAHASAHGHWTVCVETWNLFALLASNLVSY